MENSPRRDRLAPRKAALWTAVLLILLSTSARAAEKAVSVSSPSSSLSCPETAGIDTLLRKGQILLLGEMHGSRESPAFVAGAACRGLQAGRSVTVALEIPTEEEPRVAAYLASGGNIEDRDSLLAGAFWQDPFQDGRRSQAMVALLDDLRRWGKAGRKIRVKLVDRLPKAAAPERDRAMAAELEAAVKAAPDDLFLVLTGNLHTRTARGTPWDPKQENMGFLVAPSHPGLLALDVAYSGGTIWMCPDPNPASCGVQPVHGKDGERAPGVKLYEKPSPEGFHGEYFVGPLTASPPAVPPPTVPAASLSAFTIDSKLLGETRRINVYTPPGYAAHAEARFPILYMPDGGMAEDFPHVTATVQELVTAGAIRPFLVVGIENTERRRDLTGPTEVESDRKIAPRVGGSAAFRKFLREELMPQVRARYRTTDEKAIVGESLAGLFIVETFLLEPDLFDTYIAISPSLQWNHGALAQGAGERLEALRGMKKTLYLTSADEEDIVRNTGLLAATLRAKALPGVVWFYEPRPDQHHDTIYLAAAPQAFRRVLAPGGAPTAARPPSAPPRGAS
jgi:predicted alpha/beta superfamily hydrolase